MDELSLIHDAQRGDLDAFNRLVLEYQSAVYNLAYRIMGDGDSAADAAQEAFLSAFKNIRRYRGGLFKGWLMRIVTNACYDELRRRKRRPSASLEALAIVETGPDADGEAQLVSEAHSPETRAERSELARAIQRCLDDLPDDQRLAVVMCDVQGMDYAEIAQAMQSALGTVKSRIARARAKLRHCLRRAHGGELLPAAARLHEER